MNQDIKLHIVTLTRTSTGEGITDVFSVQEEAVNHFLKLAQMNSMIWSNQFTMLEDDYAEFMNGFNDKSEISFKILKIKTK